MKKKILLIALALIISVPTAVFAVSETKEDKELRKERKELMDATRKEIEKKASKDARKAAKQYKKEGWTVNPGAIPLEKQIDRSFMYQWEPAPDGSLAYYVGEGRAVAQTYDAAALQAKMAARQEIAGKIQTEITTLIETKVGNKQISSTEAASVSESLSKSQAFISQTLSNLAPVLECHRVLKNGNIEVLVSYAYSKEQATKMALDAIRKNLEDNFKDFDEKFAE